MSDTMTRRMWIAYGQAGATGTIIQDAAGYTVTMTRDSHRLGVYPTLEVAKAALQSHLPPGSDVTEYREH